MRLRFIIAKAVSAHPRKSMRAYCSALLITFYFLAWHSFAQTAVGSSSPGAGSGSVASSVGAGKYAFPSLSPAGVVGDNSTPMATSVIDNSIDEDSYYIGGGDQIHIYLVDIPSLNYSGIITQDYYFIEPTLGLIPIGGKVTLARAKEIIAEHMYQKLKVKGANKIRVLFQGVKKAQITTFGSVNSPGSHSFSGSMRLWDVLKATTSGKMSDINFREVRLKNGDSVAYFDMLPFLFNGDFSQNPYIYPGDELYLVPATNSVYVGGAGLKAWISGQIPIRQDERAKDFLSLFFFHENADSEHILIQRTENGREFQLLTFNLKHNQDFYLKDMDVISVPVKRDASEIYTITVSGEVVRGGNFPIPKAGAAVQTMIALAGGYTPFADTNKTVILRASKSPPPPGLTDGKTRPEMNAALAVAGITKDYLVIRTKDHPETALKTGDRVWVPRKEELVYISGCVMSPGGYAFSPHKKKEYYINLAGGFAERADRANIVIITPHLDSHMSKSGGEEIDAGDLIAIPVKPQYKVFERLVLPTFSMILSSASLLIAVASILNF